MKLDIDSKEPDIRIEIVPLIDVIFCILTFFILAATTLTRQAAINVDLPRADSGTNQMRKILIVSVDPIGQAYVEKLPVSDDQLYQAIVNFRQQTPDGMMVLYASRAASYNDVVRVLDRLRSAGGDRVALATLPDAGTDATSPFPNLPNGISNPGGTLNEPLSPSPNLPGATTPLPGQSGASDLFELNPAPQPRSSVSPGKATPVPNSAFELPSGSTQPRSPANLPDN